MPLTFHFQFSVFNSNKVPLGTIVSRQVWRAELGMPANKTRQISEYRRYDRGVLAVVRAFYILWRKFGGGEVNLERKIVVI